MKLKTFFISYILFLSILFGALATVSIYLTNHQMHTLREQSVREYKRIANSINREVDAVYARGANEMVIHALLNSHISFHTGQGVRLSIEEELSSLDNAMITFHSNQETYYFQVEGTLLTNAGDFRLDIGFDITEDILDLRGIQRILLLLLIVFALIAALTLYLILAWLFKPLEIVAGTSQKIAEGNYQERIHIKGKNELTAMVHHFNQMAKEIESQIKLLEDEAEKKQQFIDNLAHEIRTPLTSIYGYAQYIQQVNLNEVDKIEFAAYIMEEAKHMKKITNSMLELAKLRHFEPQKEEIELTHLFNQVSMTIERIFCKHQIRLIIRPCEYSVLGQPDLLKSLLLNLCVNAMKACTPKIGEVVLEAKEEKEKKLVISVSDNGYGISKEDITKVTEPFYRVDNARNRKRGGIGLGLALCKQIAQIHGAELMIRSEINEGTTVKVVFTTS